MALNADSLANDLIQQLGIPEGEAQAKIRTLAVVLVKHFQDNAEVDIGDVAISTPNVSLGTDSAAATKSGSGRLR